MPIRHVFIGILIAAIWGTNFIFIKMALQDIPPFTLAALRFFLVGVPLVFFLPRPQVPWRQLIEYGVLMFAVQFGFLFLGMRWGVSAGLASLLMQVQVFFTMGLAVLVFKERPNFLKILGALIAFVGVGLVGLHTDQDVNLAGFVLILAASLSWATGNILVKRMPTVNPLALVAWGGLVAFPPLVLVAFSFEGASAYTWVTQEIHLSTVISVAYIVYLSTHVAYSLWGWLLRHHSASNVVPFTLLVPIFGMISSAIVLREQIPDWKIFAGILVIAGLCVNLYGARRASR